MTTATCGGFRGCGDLRREFSPRAFRHDSVGLARHRFSSVERWSAVGRQLTVSAGFGPRFVPGSYRLGLQAVSP